MKVMSLRCWRKERGVSATTWRTRIRVCGHESDRRRGRSEARTHFEVLDEASEEGGKVLCASDVPWDRFAQNVRRKNYSAALACARRESGRHALGFAMKSSSSA